MKKICTLLFFIAATLSFTIAKANTVYVIGNVKNNGVAVANKAVKVWVDSTVGSCYQSHIRYTNAAGVYTDTLSCNYNIANVLTSTEGCSGTIVTNTSAVNNGVAESNFALTCTTPSTCTAYYTASINGNTVTFTNASVANSNLVASVWSFGDGTSSTVASPSHVYTVNGTYNVCLRILSSTNCSDSICKTITITSNTPPVACNAEFQFAPDSISNPKLIRFYAGVNTVYPNNDPVIERKWKFGDGDSLLGNIQNPTHTYLNAGAYNVCLRVKTQSGCVSDLCKTVVVVNPTPPPFVCTATVGFSYIPVSTLAKFNSSVSSAGANDTIISRRWVFGDSSAVLTGNVIDPQHQYAQPGMYNVCLTIKTVKGCERSICMLITATNVNSTCVPQFTTLRIAPKKMSFNSTMSWAPQSDSIIERKWTFGDGTSLLGNVANPTHEYINLGIYTVCLRIKTAAGCVNEVCKPVLLQDSIQINNNAGAVNILSLYPNPVTTQLTTVVWSASNNIAAELAIYDIYGTKKWSLNKNLLQGNNITTIPTSFLLSGPYFFKVKTVYGIKTRSFYKL